jgi:hypothetical protein
MSNVENEGQTEHAFTKQCVFERMFFTRHRVLAAPPEPETCRRPVRLAVGAAQRHCDPSRCAGWPHAGRLT